MPEGFPYTFIRYSWLGAGEGERAMTKQQTPQFDDTIHFRITMSGIVFAIICAVMVIAMLTTHDTVHPWHADARPMVMDHWSTAVYTWSIGLAILSMAVALGTDKIRRRQELRFQRQHGQR